MSAVLPKIDPAKHLANILIILIIGVFVYANSFGNEFVWDDDYLIVNNIFIKDWHYIGKIFSTNLFAGSWGDSTFYRPIQSLTYLADYSIWKLNPFGYHLTNTLIHIANAILIYLLAQYLIKIRFAALFTSLLFLVHPVQTEAVTYISGRADPLVALFLLISFISFIKLRYILSLCAFILAFLSKEAGLIFPVILLVYCLLDKNTQGKKRPLFLGIFFLTAIIYLLTRSYLFDFLQAPFASSAGPLFTRIVISCKAFVHYLGFIVFPFGLHMERQLNISGSLFEPDIWISLVLLIIFIILAVRPPKESKAASFGLSWFLIALIPTAGILPINAFIAEHWLYLPSIGLFLALTSYFPKKRNFAILMSIILSALAVLTIKQNTVWKNKETLYKHILKFNPASSRAHFNLGSVYGERKADDMAIPEFNRAIELKKDYIDAYVNLGYAYQKKGETSKAINIFKEAIRISPNDYLPYYYLANLYNDTGRASESIDLYKKALALKSINPNIYFDLARAYDKMGGIDEAIAMYQKCIELSREYLDAYINLGAIYAQKGLFGEAKGVWEKGLKLAPDNQDLKQNLKKLDRLIGIKKDKEG